MVDFKSIVSGLVASGLSEEAIAGEVRKITGGSITQPTIHRIKTGTEPRYSIGAALRALYEGKAVA